MRLVRIGSSYPHNARLRRLVYKDEGETPGESAQTLYPAPEGRQTYQDVCKRVGHENITYPFDVI